MRRERWDDAQRRAFTVVEVLLAVILSVVLLSLLYKVFTHARNETQKGFWLQESITDLRNFTRLLTTTLRKTSYPSTIQTAGGKEMVISYKEWREYDDSGRLRNMLIKTNDPGMDLQVLPGTSIPEVSTRLMLFPVCTPEKDSQMGQIRWYEVILEPSPLSTKEQPLGVIRFIEREDSYQTAGLPRRAYDLKKAFSDQLPVRRDKVMVRDVTQVDLECCASEELRGISVGEKMGSSIVKHKRNRYMITLRISTAFHRDLKVVLRDQSAVVINLDVAELAGGFDLQVLETTGSGETRQAKIFFNEATLQVGKGQVVRGLFEVTSVFADGITIRFLPGTRTRSFYISS